MDPRGHNFHDLQPVISVDDVASTIAHYQEMLGFKVDFTFGDPPIFARVSREKVMIQFGKSDAEFPAGCVKWYNIGLGHVDGPANMDELYAEFVGKGVNVTMPPTIQPYGLREFEIEDSNRIRIRFSVDCK